MYPAAYDGMGAKMMNFKIKFGSKKGLFFLAVFCVVCIIITIAAISQYFFFPATTDAAVRASGKNDLNFRVYYRENDIFGSGPMPAELNYLISFTAYFEIENSFSAEFSQETDALYQYTVSETLLIKQVKGPDNNTNPVVYEEKTALTKQSGTVTGRFISFQGAIGEPGGVYIIDPEKQINTYRQFMNEQSAQMRKINITAERGLSFSAELLVDFTYNIHAEEIGVNETLTRGYRIPLSNEVYNFEDTGMPMFELSVPVREHEMPGLGITLLIFLWFIANVTGVCYGIRQLTIEKNEQLREAKRIFKKYEDDIIFAADPPDLSEYKIIPVPYFRELLKLAVNLSKHILCFYNDEKADFCTVADGYAYCYSIYYKEQ